MKSYEMESYDVVVVGAGHAGCEAALAAARLGKKTLILTISLEAVAMMPCNPSIGGTGKGQLVREIDALGGEMGLLIDKTFIQSRMLNRSKGPAVHSPRAQADKQRYHMEMKHRLEQQENLDLRQGEVVDLLISAGAIHGVLLKSGAVYPARTVILATGTYLNGLIHVSASAYPSGPGGMSPSLELPERMREYGFRLRRFKTGTPARVLATSLHYEALEEQKGDAEVAPFSFLNDDVGGNQKSCWLTYTNPEAHKIVAENIEKTAPYGGYTTGVGPRYCLSIEDKVSRFPERTRHQLFLEPEGMYTEEVYVQGMSTSLPEDIQIRFYRSIAGMENAKISRYAYSIEYDCLDPLSLKSSLEHREVAKLFCAGQINGSSGYEEAAAQGLIAGINAARSLDGKEPYVPDRSEAYIGVLIDDLTTKGTEEPYRIMTSRAEFRLILRQDNADLRLTEKGYRLGLASRERYERYLKNKEDTEREIRRLEESFLSPEQGTAFLRGLVGEKVAAAGTDVVVEEVAAVGTDVVDGRIGGVGSKVAVAGMDVEEEEVAVAGMDVVGVEVAAVGTDVVDGGIGGVGSKVAVAGMDVVVVEVAAAGTDVVVEEVAAAGTDVVVEKIAVAGTSLVKELKGRISLADLLKRPEVTYENMKRIDRGRPALSTYARTQAEIQIKYAGYIDKQKQQVEKFRKLEGKRIPADLDYGALSGLRLEAMQKLGEQRPTSIGQASRISGVSPADINVLLIHLMRMGR